jgi:hypothetical protein
MVLSYGEGKRAEFKGEKRYKTFSFLSYSSSLSLSFSLAPLDRIRPKVYKKAFLWQKSAASLKLAVLSSFSLFLSLSCPHPFVLQRLPLPRNVLTHLLPTIYTSSFIPYPNQYLFTLACFHFFFWLPLSPSRRFLPSNLARSQSAQSWTKPARLDDGRVTFALPHLGRHLDTLTPLLLSAPTPEESAAGELMLDATSPWAALHAYVYHVLPRLPPHERHAMSARLSRVLATVAHHVTAHALQCSQPAQPATGQGQGSSSAAGVAAAADKCLAESAADKLRCMAQLTQRLDALVAGDLYNEQVVGRVKNVLRRQAVLLCQAHFILQKWHVTDESGLTRRLAQCLGREGDADKVDGSCFARLATASAPPPRQDEDEPAVAHPSPMELCGYPVRAAHVVAGSWAALRACVEADVEQCLENAASQIYAGASAALLSTIPFTGAEVSSFEEAASMVGQSLEHASAIL